MKEVPYTGYSQQHCRQAAQLLCVIGLLSSGSFRMSEAPRFKLHLAVPGQPELFADRIMVADTHIHSQVVLLCS